MAWTNALNYAKKMLGDKLSHDVSDRQDSALPFKARIGSLVKWQLRDFILAESKGSLMSIPEHTEGVVCSVSRLKFDDSDSGKQYRFYLQRDDVDGNETFIHVYVDENNTPIDAMYCTTLARIIPQTEDEQAAFTGCDGYGLGDQEYCLSRENLSDTGRSEALLDRILSDQQVLGYLRAINTDDTNHMSPLVGTETRIDDPAGEKGLSQKVFFMPYFRKLQDGNTDEFLLISTEIVSSKDGDDSCREIHVDLMVGITLNMGGLSIQ